MSKIEALRENYRKAHSVIKPNVLNNCVLVGTHHKTGTVWLKSIFNQIASKYALKFRYSVERAKKLTPCDREIFVHAHSNFALDRLPSNSRGLHMIRDPRDVVVSACFYHQKGVERPMHIPMFQGGLSYQQKICSYESQSDRLLFEMEHYSAGTIRDMINWDYNNPQFLELKYEDLIDDHEKFWDIFVFLGFNRVDTLMKIAAANHKDAKVAVREKKHIRSGQSGQWKKYFTNVHKTKFKELFGSIAVDLGYEDTNDW